MCGNRVAQNVTGIGGYNINLIFGNVGIDIANIQQLIGVMLLLRHTEYAPDGLNGELVARQLTENKQYGSTRAIPAQGDRLLEQKHLREVCGILKSVKV